MRPRARVRSGLLAALALALALLAPLAGCIFTQDTVTPLDASARPEGKPLKIDKTAKAHLDDGSVVLFHKGFEVGDGELRGPGEQFDLTRTQRSQVQSVPLARVAALEAYQREPHGPLSAAGIILGVPAAVVGTGLLFVAIFGSCPTVYSPAPGGELLEAELYSHSIAQRFEGNDLDRLEGARPVDGTIRLRIANEALETHYTNRLELVAADHPPGFEALPTPAGGVALLGSAVPLGGARSRAGREVGAAIAARGDAWYQTGPDLDAEAAQRPTDDWIEGTIEVPPGAATVTVGLRLRNTLLDTVLLYDVLLRPQGASALAWLDRFDHDPLAAWRWHSWFDGRFALRVLLEEEGTFREVARVPVTGPIAWHQTAVTFPVMAAGTTRLRLASLADNWQVDWVGVSAREAPRARLTVIPAGTVTGPDGAPAPAALAAIRGDDGEYLSTGPGESYTLSFPAGEPRTGERRTWLLGSSGYYVEWLRGEWLTAAARAPASPPEPGDAAVVAASRLWAAKRESFEREFFSTRIGGEGRP